MPFPATLEAKSRIPGPGAWESQITDAVPSDKQYHKSGHAERAASQPQDVACVSGLLVHDPAAILACTAVIVGGNSLVRRCGETELSEWV
jgi:hypothetical protein